jgi:2-polyprenyl-3-methyl-5-hydroxy-6-metoxy-1,4-benzoquinol methylase
MDKKTITLPVIPEKLNYIDEYSNIFDGGEFLRNGKVITIDDIKVFDGGSIKSLIGKILEDIKNRDSVTILDYGSGHGLHWHERKINSKSLTEHIGLKLQSFYKYDPAVVEYKKKPIGVFDMVICTDVLEHVPIDDVPSVLDDLNKYCHTNGNIYLSIATHPSHNSFKDGTNMHITIMPSSKWEELIKRYINKKIVVEFN